MNDSKHATQKYAEPQSRPSEAQLIRRERQMMALLAADMAISSSLELSQVLDTVTRELANLLNVEACALSQWDQKKNTIGIIAEHRTNDRWEYSDEGQTLDLDNYPHRKFVLEEHLVEQMTVNRPDLDTSERNHMVQANIKSTLMFPMAHKDRVIGLVEVMCEKDRIFTQEEITFAQLIANKAAVAIENARLFLTMQRKLEEETALLHAVSALSSTLDHKAILKIIIKEMGEALDVTSAYISKYNDSQKTSTVLAEYYGPHASEVERVSDMYATYDHTQVMKSIVDFMETGSVLVEHVDDPELSAEERALFIKNGCKTALTIPVSYGKRFNAYAKLWESRSKRDFTKGEISFCETLAQYAAIAIEKARLFDQAQEEIENRKLIEEQLRHDAIHDELTGIPNRTLFLDRLERAILRKQRNPDYQFAMLFLDLDQFKLINDSFGHNIGDEFLIEISRRMQNTVRAVDTLARFGGDEFVFLLDDLKNEYAPERCAERILSQLKDPIYLDGHSIITSASIGIVKSSIHYQRPEEYLRDADIAMYKAKEEGRSRYVLFKDDLRDYAINRLTLDSELRRALENKEFILHYQPISELDSNVITGFEALIRWNHPDRGIILPGDFIPHAEEIGLILPIGEWVLDEAIKQIKEWNNQFNPEEVLTMNVNVSGKQLHQSDFVITVKRYLKKHNLPPNCLCLEVTENAIIHEIEAASKAISEFKRVGVRVQMDDFGTGHSALNYLREFPVDGIKIDRSFVSNINQNQRKSALVNMILVLARELEMGVIAEGIESDHQRNRLIELGCAYGQGFHLCRPIDRNDIENLLTAQFSTG